MTLVADINSMTMTAYDSTSVTNAATLASNIATGIIGSTFVYVADDPVSTGVAMLGARILDRGKNSYEARNSETPVPIDNFQSLVTKEIKALILSVTSTISYNAQPTSADYYSAPPT